MGPWRLSGTASHRIKKFVSESRESRRSKHHSRFLPSVWCDTHSTRAGARRSWCTNSVLMINANTGELSSIADDFVRPNGLCFDPTEKLMYIAHRCSASPATGTADRIVAAAASWHNSSRCFLGKLPRGVLFRADLCAFSCS